MATKSFTTEFKFNAKAGEKLINAIEKSRRVDHEVKQSVENVTKKEEIEFIVSSLSEDK